MIRSVREPSSLTSQRPPPQTPLAMTGLDPGPTPGQAGAAAKNDPAASARNTATTSAE
jgi:hypothetical protein